MDITGKFEQALLNFDRIAARNIMRDAVQQIAAIDFIEQAVVPALEKIGCDWEQNEVALSQVYMSGRICEELINDLLPPGAPERKSQPRMAIAVLHDHHLLGKRIVYSLLRSAGYELSDYGVIDAKTLVERVKKDGIRVLLISVLMLSSALHIKEVSAALKADGLDTKIIVGGAPFLFDRRLWRDVNADAMCSRASQAPETVEILMGGLS